ARTSMRDPTAASNCCISNRSTVEMWLLMTPDGEPETEVAPCGLLCVAPGDACAPSASDDDDNVGCDDEAMASSASSRSTMRSRIGLSVGGAAACSISAKNTETSLPRPFTALMNVSTDGPRLWLASSFEIAFW